MSKHIAKIEIENLKALKGKHTFIPGGQSFFLIGSNGKGKTTVGRTIADILVGKYPSVLTTTGEDEGMIEVTLDDGHKIQLRFDPKHRPSLTVTTTDGEALAAPKAYLSKLLGQKGITFDIDTFLNLQPLPRAKMMQTILGVDLEELNEREVDLIEKRKYANAIVRDQQGRVEPYDKSLVGTEHLSVVDGMAKLQEMKDHNAIHVSCEERQTLNNTEVLKLETMLAEWHVKQVKDRNEWEAMTDPHTAEVIEEFAAKINDISAHNAQVVDANRCYEEHQRLRTYSDSADALDQNVKDIRAEKETALRAAPLPGKLSWGEKGEILHDGLPFDDKQISTSARVIAGLQIAEQIMGELRFLHFEGSILDSDSAGVVMEWAEANDMQLAFERVSWEETDIEIQIIES